MAYKKGDTVWVQHHYGVRSWPAETIIEEIETSREGNVLYLTRDEGWRSPCNIWSDEKSCKFYCSTYDLMW